MNQSPKKIINPIRIALLGSIILAVLLLILLGGSYLRQNAAKQLEADRIALEENLATLQEINQEQLHELQVELDEINAEIDGLEISFPELGAPFAIYRRGLDISQNNQVDLKSIYLIGTDLQETVNGTVLIESYNINLEGKFTACINFIGEIEEAGLDTVNIVNAIFLPDEESCSIDISAIGYATNPE